MVSEQLSPSAIKLLLTAEETEGLPSRDSHEDLRQYIRHLVAKIRREGIVSLPRGRLLAEIYLISDGSCAIFISVTEQHGTTEVLYACEIIGIDRLTGLINALSDSGAECSLYCGREPQTYRLIFHEPTSHIGHICREYGDYCEISELFAAQTAEYLTVIAEDCSIETLKELLS